VLDQDEGEAIYFWDHELGKPLTRLIEGFDVFLDKLEPFGPESVELPSGIKVTVRKPDLLRRLKDGLRRE
jgi:hypothetical protein